MEGAKGKGVNEKRKFLSIFVSRKVDFGLEKSLPFRLAVTKNSNRKSYWEKGDRFYQRLIFGRYSPDSYVFVIPGNANNTIKTMQKDN